MQIPVHVYLNWWIGSHRLDIRIIFVRNRFDINSSQLKIKHVTPQSKSADSLVAAAQGMNLQNLYFKMLSR